MVLNSYDYFVNRTIQWREGKKMRVRTMRWDMAVCLGLMVLTVLGLLKLNEKIEFGNKFLDMLKPYFDEVTEVPDGEVGGFATKDLPRLKTEEEIRNVKGYFTMEMTYIELYNMGTVEGMENTWNVVKVDNGRIVAIKLNTNKIQKIKNDSNYEGSYKQILPTGTCVHRDSEVYELLKKRYKEYEVIDDFYIDMDGMAGSSKVVASNEMMGILIFLESFLPIIAFAGAMGIIFLYHWIGVKMGIFPPIFNRNK